MEFKWLNESEVIKTEQKIEIKALPKSDYFCDHSTRKESTELPQSLTNAPFYYTEITGDFVMKVKVSLDFVDIYDASAIMVMQDLTHWGKACFEFTDFDTHAVVSVVTNGQSDDANGCNIEEDSVWLQLCRVDDSFAFHYSIDGENFYMMRFFTFPVEETVKVGLVAQSPKGEGGLRTFENLTIEKKTVKNIREGK